MPHCVLAPSNLLRVTPVFAFAHPDARGAEYAVTGVAMKHFHLTLRTPRLTTMVTQNERKLMFTPWTLPASASLAAVSVSVKVRDAFLKATAISMHYARQPLEASCELCTWCGKGAAGQSKASTTHTRPNRKGPSHFAARNATAASKRHLDLLRPPLHHAQLSPFPFTLTRLTPPHHPPAHLATTQDPMMPASPGFSPPA